MNGHFIQTRDSVVDLMKKGHWKQARKIVQLQYQTNPDLPQYQVHWSMVLEAFGYTVKALELAEKAARETSIESSCWLQVARAARTLSQSTSVFSPFAFVHKSKAALERATKLAPRDPDVLAEMIKFHAITPKVLGGDRSEGERQLTLLRSITQSQEALMTSLLHKKDALSILQMASIESPTSFELSAELCKALVAEKRHAEAEQVTLRLLKLDPERIDGHRYLAPILVWQERWRDLDEALARSDRMRSEDRSAWYWAAEAMYRSGREGTCATRFVLHYMEQEPEGMAPSIEDAHRLLSHLRKQDRQ